MKQHTIKKYLEWRQWVMPKLLRERPIHRWLVFPHSFTDDIVKALISEWGLGTNDLLVDPFIGAGTTILAANEAGVPATGFDLSPLAVMVKKHTYCFKRMEFFGWTDGRTTTLKVINRVPEY